MSAVVELYVLFKFIRRYRGRKNKAQLTSVFEPSVEYFNMAHAPVFQLQMIVCSLSSVRARRSPSKVTGFSLVVIEYTLLNEYVESSAWQRCMISTKYFLSTEKMKKRAYKVANLTHSFNCNEIAIVAFDLSSLFIAKPVKIAPRGLHSHNLLEPIPSSISHIDTADHILFDIVINNPSCPGTNRTSETEIPDAAAILAALWTDDIPQSQRRARQQPRLVYAMRSGVAKLSRSTSGKGKPREMTWAVAAWTHTTRVAVKLCNRWQVWGSNLRESMSRCSLQVNANRVPFPTEEYQVAPNMRLCRPRYPRLSCSSVMQATFQTFQSHCDLLPG